MAFSPDGTRLATGGADGTLRVLVATEQRDAPSIPSVGPFALSKVTACIPARIRKTALEGAEDRKRRQ